MEQTLVSIVVPAFNAAPYLKECIGSILSQTYRHLEVIIIDDGCTDATPVIADDYASGHPAVKVIHLSHGGPSSARNSGAEMAIGHYITFVDADDTLHPRFVETALSEMESTGADIFSCDIIRDPKRRWSGSIARARAIAPREAIEAVLYQRKGMLGSAWGHVYKTSIVRAERFTPGIWYEDLDFFHRAYQRSAAIAHTPTPLYFYRINPAGIMHTFADKRLDVLDVTDRIAARYHDDQRLLKAATDRRFSAHFNMFVLCSRHAHQARKRCWRVVAASKTEILLNSKSRLKNRLGALVACLGPRATMWVANLFYRTS